MEEHFKQQTILIVDDSSFHSAYLSDILIDQYQIIVAANGKDALEIAFSQNPPDLILLDVVMPEMDGYDVCKRLKSIISTKDIPIIFITGKIEEDDEIYGFTLGAVDYISKPFNPIIVKARIKTHMKLKMYRDYLETISYMDGLTNIPNRRRFDEQFELIWNIAKRENTVISLIMMDIDNFKAFNDIYGHQAGDECLIQVAQQLYNTFLRKTDFVGRYGGEEFVCILPNTTLENSFLIAEKMRERVMELEIQHGGSQITNIITISLGLASCFPEKESLSSKLIEQADIALYQSKKSGRNKTSINFQPNVE